MKSSAPRKFRPFSGLWRSLFYLRRRIRGVRDRPHTIACGLGLGTFAACLPIFGGQTAIAVLLAILFRGNKLCAALATWFSNPLTYVPIFWLNYNLGLLLLPNFQAPDRLRWDSFDDMLVQMRDISIPLGLGSIVMGLLLGAAVYTVSLSLLMVRSRRIERRRQALIAQRASLSPDQSEQPAMASSGKPPKIVEYNQ
jgi:uncharacterized protein (DUF2062 family)